MRIGFIKGVLIGGALTAIMRKMKKRNMLHDILDRKKTLKMGRGIFNKSTKMMKGILRVFS